jgi:hypothetical protein
LAFGGKKAPSALHDISYLLILSLPSRSLQAPSTPLQGRCSSGEANVLWLSSRSLIFFLLLLFLRDSPSFSPQYRSVPHAIELLLNCLVVLGDASALGYPGN